jgi:hypothetical protein
MRRRAWDDLGSPGMCRALVLSGIRAQRVDLGIIARSPWAVRPGHAFFQAPRSEACRSNNIFGRFHCQSVVG